MNYLYKMRILAVFISVLIGVGSVYAHEGHEFAYGEDVVSQGEFSLLQAGVKKKIKVSGWVQMVRLAEGKTEVTVYLEGLAPNTTYPAHIHTLPCEAGGGQHYKIDPYDEDTSESNEIWPTIETDENGVGKANIRVRHWARSDAQSLVVHDPKDGSKLACADIFLVQTQVSSDF